MVGGGHQVRSGLLEPSASGFVGAFRDQQNRRNPFLYKSLTKPQVAFLPRAPGDWFPIEQKEDTGGFAHDLGRWGVKKSSFPREANDEKTWRWVRTKPLAAISACGESLYTHPA